MHSPYRLYGAAQRMCAFWRELREQAIFARDMQIAVASSEGSASGAGTTAVGEGAATPPTAATAESSDPDWLSLLPF